MRRAPQSLADARRVRPRLQRMPQVPRVAARAAL